MAINVQSSHHKFEMCLRCYPIVGKLVHPPCAESVPQMTVEDLALHKGCEEIPEGSAAAPIYVAVKGDIFDVRYGNFRMCLRCIIIQLCQYGVDRRIGDASLGVKFKHPSHLSHHSLHEYTICDD
eukprot:122175_1